MRGLADTAGMPNVRSCWAFIHGEIVCQDRPLEMKHEFTPDLYHSEVRAVCGQFFSTTFGHMFSLPFLRSSSVAAFRDPNSDNRNEACLAVSRQAHEIITPEASYSHTAFLNIRQDSSPKGERCMKDTDHPVDHLSVHLRIFGRVRSRRSCAWHNDQFGRGQNTGLGWSDPTFVHGSVPKVIRGVAPAQLRGDRAECFVRSAFCSRRPQQ
jgi:hypothetical protein